MVSTDLNFMLNSWMRSYRESWCAKAIPAQIYFDSHERLIRRILNDNGQVFIAANDEDQSQIHGFICYARDILPNVLVVHYVYVKSPYRKFGVGSALMAEAAADVDHDPMFPVVATHISRDFEMMFPKAAYNPYLLGAFT